MVFQINSAVQIPLGKRYILTCPPIGFRESHETEARLSDDSLLTAMSKKMFTSDASIGINSKCCKNPMVLYSALFLNMPWHQQAPGHLQAHWWRSSMHTHTHTHTYIYIYIFIYVCVYGTSAMKFKCRKQVALQWCTRRSTENVLHWITLGSDSDRESSHGLMRLLSISQMIILHA